MSRTRSRREASSASEPAHWAIHPCLPAEKLLMFDLWKRYLPTHGATEPSFVALSIIHLVRIRGQVPRFGHGVQHTESAADQFVSLVSGGSAASVAFGFDPSLRRADDAWRTALGGARPDHVGRKPRRQLTRWSRRAEPSPRTSHAPGCRRCVHQWRSWCVPAGQCGRIGHSAASVIDGSRPRTGSVACTSGSWRSPP